VTAALIALLVLGGEHPHRYSRSRAALACYRANQAARLVVSGGARVLYREAGSGKVPPPVREAEHMARWLLAAGVPAAHIWQEPLARDTLGNIVLGVALAQSRGIGSQQIVLVSDDFHLPRCRWLFCHVFGHEPLDTVGSGIAGTPWLRWREPLALAVQRLALARGHVARGDVARHRHFVLGNAQSLGH